jgi:hypothetical protein
MIVLFDHGIPAPLRTFLKDHTVKDAKSQGWDTLGNGDLLDAAEAAGFDVLLTTDKNLRYQQNLAGRKIAIVVLGNAQWPVLRLHVESVGIALNAAAPGTYTEVDIPNDA